MLMQCNPAEAYRRVDFDARVEGASGAQLIALCFEQMTAAIGTAIYAAEIRDNALKSRSLTRALSALTALQLGVTGEDAVADALRQLYHSAHSSILDCAVNFDAGKLRTIRDDFTEIAGALGTS
ncbi:MAG TPA: flagellar protein FliS [Novosphingobium sp.]|nr:flagellar protein FliS [Novosphingobium sp.]